MTNFNTRLGLDLGTDSIGWMLYRLADNGEITSVIGGGVRIFSEGRNAKSLASLNEDRRKARGIRRNLFRKKQRRNRLLKSLAESGLFPAKTENGEIVPDYIAGKKLETLDPWRLRAEAVEKRLPPHHIGRALFHLNQRRGYKSNTKTDDKQDSKVVGKARSKLRKNMEAAAAKTLGQYLYLRRQAKNEPSHKRTVRARPLKVTPAGVQEYEPLYPFRDDIAEEFDKIWETQKAANADFGKNKNGECGREAIRACIVDQRDLKRPIVGKCPFYPDLDRAPMALPSFQRFRILNDLNHLEYRDGRGLHQLNVNEREKILDGLLHKERLSFEAMRKEILGNEAAEFNYERTIRQKRKKNASKIREGEQKRRKDINGDVTGCKLRKALGQRWETLQIEHESLLASQDKFVQTIMDESEKDARKNFVAWNLNLSESEMEASFTIIAGLPKGRARFSGEAIRALIPCLEEGMLLDDAIDEAQADGKIGGKADTISGEIYGELPPYQKVARLRHLCLPRTPADEDNPENRRIPNPTVHVALNQLRAVVNDIIRIHDIDNRSLQIALEIGRDLPVGAKGRREREKENLANRDNNERIAACLKQEFGDGKVTGRNIKKRKLWEELAKNKLDRKCVFCGKQISARDLMSEDGGIQLEHILPFGDTLDNGYMNLTLACRACNQAKGNRDPFTAFADDDMHWSEIQKRASRLPHAKFKRFQKGALEKYSVRGRNFLPRQLPETQYISRAALHYLQAVCEDVYVVPGRLTGLLRAKWGLNSILAGFREDADENRNTKNREDHRHHAIDAAVVGATTRGALQKVATAANTGMGGEQLFVDKVPFPTAGEENFRRMVKSAIGKIIVSHKPRRHKSGKLHDETAYRIVKQESSHVIVSHHIPISNLEEKALYADSPEDEFPDIWGRAAKLRDHRNLRRRLIEWRAEFDGDFKKATAKAREYGVRRVEVMKRPRADSLIPIYHKGKGGDSGVKHYLPGNNWAYEIRLCRNGLWKGKAITTFDANTCKSTDDSAESSPLVMRLHCGDTVILGRLEGGDLVKLDKENAPIIACVREISERQVALAEHTDSNPRQRSKEGMPGHDRRIYLSSGESFRVRRARKIDVSPAGLMRKRPIPAAE